MNTHCSGAVYLLYKKFDAGTAKHAFTYNLNLHE